MMAEFILPPPKNWDVFENICCDLWKNIWADPATHIHGRRGQIQNGIDIYGKPLFASKYSGVQCKGKNGNYDSKLTKNEIDEECNKAVNFKPDLDTFIIATTSPRDQKTQEHCRAITQQQKYPFIVDSWAWEDIEEEIRFRPEIVERFYNNGYEEMNLLNSISISPFSPVQKLRAFFTRPGIFNNLNSLALQILDNLVQELVINAFNHGNASYFKVEVQGFNIRCIDNGKKFNPLSLLENGARIRGGGETLKDAAGLFSINYAYNATENILELEYEYDIDSLPANGLYSICVGIDDLFGRQHANSFAIQEFGKIPFEASKIIVDICGKYNPCRSGSYGLVDTIQKVLAPHQKVTIILPLGMYYAESLIEKYRDDDRIAFVEKDKL